MAAFEQSLVEYHDRRKHRGNLPPPRAFDLRNIEILFELSLGLSAWKSYGANRWTLRCNPSSGNLHPTEGYLLCRPLDGLSPACPPASTTIAAATIYSISSSLV